MQWPICGPKLSLCCSIISIWGIIQFLLLGIFFIVQAAPLIDDFDFNDKNATDIHVFDEGLKAAFHQRAFNCWIAAVLYVILLIFTGMQFRIHLKQSSIPVPPTITSPFAGVTTEGNDINSQHGIQFTTDHSET
ncbi:unnamed protein product [Rotaria magnacalcarata]|nr:unnamed protein product [Rotaria magnacalcarata]CAF1638434.1 unnamed protein product [Rotaria magnacalcarata]CAF1940313.1 unnamed protein product [Rotaria magnacalcarata]CAF2061361.1 unnamed protein product [Rotaria magnacalcarata]CAF4275302.1 unnamed protein product [Rotaria magnacalcarata]